MSKFPQKGHRKMTNSEIKKELLPCPLCGNKGQIYNPGNDVRIFSVQCEMAGCISGIGHSHSKASAIDDWNTRTPEPTKEYKRNQPCGCVMCVCQDEKQCHGCGAKSCANWREEGHREKFIFKDESINITKEQLLAILPHKTYHHATDNKCQYESDEDTARNTAIDQMKQRIEEVFMGYTKNTSKYLSVDHHHPFCAEERKRCKENKLSWECICDLMSRYFPTNYVEKLVKYPDCIEDLYK